MFLQHVATFIIARHVPKACLRGDVVMVEQLLFFGINPEICCNWFAFSAIDPVGDICISGSVFWPSLFGLFLLDHCLLGVGKVYAADDFKAEKEWLDLTWRSFCIFRCVTVSCRFQMQNHIALRKEYLHLPSFAMCRHRFENSYTDYSGTGWKFGRTSL